MSCFKIIPVRGSYARRHGIVTSVLATAMMTVANTTGSFSRWSRA